MSCPLQSDPARALRLAAANRPPELVPQLVLISDGVQTAGDLAKAAAGLNLPVDILPLQTWAGPEVCLVDLTSTPAPDSPEEFILTIVIQSNHADHGQLRLWESKQLLETVPIEMTNGPTMIERRVTHDASRRVIRAEITAEQDLEPGNNHRTVILPAAPRTSVLLVSAQPESAQRMAGMLQAAGMEVRNCTPAELPEIADKLAPLALVVLFDVDARKFSKSQADALDQFVHRGGGLMVVGGESTYGAQSLAGTRLEAMLPLAAVRETVLPPTSLALVLVIDTSGSMRDGGRLEMAQQAARLVVDEVGQEDALGILAFSSASQWVVPLDSIQDKAAVLAQIDALRARGGTNMAPALQRARLALAESVADRRHLILLTDGISVPGDFQEIAAELSAAGITLSAVSIGDAADERLLAAMARTAHGRYYHCAESSAVPQVLVAETRTAAAEASPPRRPLVLHQLPRLPQADGLHLAAAVETVAKPGSELLLLADSGAPLLAWWRLGTGLVVSVAAQVDSGASEFNSAETSFWSRLAQLAQRRPERDRQRYWMVAAGTQTRFSIDAWKADGEFQNGAPADLRIHTPAQTYAAGAEIQRTLRQIGPGRYEAAFASQAIGTYDLQLKFSDADGEHRQALSWTRDFPAELQFQTTGPDQLRAVATSSGGRIVSAVDELYRDDGRRTMRSIPLWPPLVMAAMGLLVADAWRRRLQGKGA